MQFKNAIKFQAFHSEKGVSVLKFTFSPMCVLAALAALADCHFTIFKELDHPDHPDHSDYPVHPDQDKHPDTYPDQKELSNCDVSAVLHSCNVSIWPV